MNIVMRTKWILLLAVVAIMAGCDTEVENIVIQKPIEHDEQYYADLRAWKQTEHEVSYAYFASYTNAKSPTSWGERLRGLPDSLDIVNLWSDIPTPEDWPMAHGDMVYCQQTLGTRFVMHADAAHYNHECWDREWDPVSGSFRICRDASGNPVAVKTVSGDEATIRAYARWAVDTLVRCGLDGVDFDYEGWRAQDITWLADECDKYLGINGHWPEKLLIIDWFNGAPPAETEPYVDYYVRQAYTWQIGFQTSSGGRPVDKTILCESMGAEAADGGINGARIRDYAAWEPEEGHKAGCGAFYLDYNYKSQSGIPYKEFREAIQIMNPARHP